MTHFFNAMTGVHHREVGVAGWGLAKDGVTFDIIADGIVAAAKEVNLSVPLVVRLEGTNVEEGKKIIRESKLNVLPADNLDDAAQKIVNAVKGG